MPWPLLWMILHIVCFLRWQQVWRTHDLNWSNGTLLSLAALLLLLQFHPWQVLVWIILLTGFTGGYLSYVSGERLSYGLALLFLGTELLLGAVPKLSSAALDPVLYTVLGYGLPLLPFSLLLAMGRRQETSPLPGSKTPDLLQGAALSLLAALLALGCVFVSRVAHFNYLSVLALMLFFGGVLLLLAGWLFSPRAGLRGLARVWADSLFNLGTPVLHWITELSLLAREPLSPEQFLDQALARLTQVPNVKGMHWSTRLSRGRRGEHTRHELCFLNGDLMTSVYTNRPAPLSMVMHFQILVQLTEHYYTSKLYERELERSTRLQAVHEAGARLTHDIKNLLQALQTLLSVLARGRIEAGREAALRGQVEEISKRLRLVLDKLSTPEKTAPVLGALRQWWEELQRRYAGSAVEFKDCIRSDPRAPVELLDSVAGNLLENARRKQQLDPRVRVWVHLKADEQRYSLSVCDDGAPIPGETAAHLLQRPLSSTDGLGIGLYQAARLAALLHCRLRLQCNKMGRVCFELSGAAVRDQDS